jgi:pSer/pThr/pTyr-binding forkhead associated (FHA) protein
MADWLRVRGEGAGGRLDVDDELTVGREQPGLGAVADDVELSRRHARFARAESGGLAVEDLGSTNGTFVNGKRISARTELRPGDVVQVGATELEVVGDATTQESATPPADPRATKPSPAAAPPAPPAAPPPVAAPAPAARAAAPPPPPPPRRAASPPPPAPRPRDKRVPVLAILLLLALAALALSLLLDREDDGASTTAAAEPAYDGTAYVLSNRQQAGQNSVIAIRYGSAGFDPLRLREYPTKGVGTSEAGMGAPTDGDQQIQVDRKRKLLFAVNQGSDTIAVFHILDDGGLEHVKGSPFPSGGTGPISVGLSDATVLVVNKGYDGKRKLNDPGMVAQFQLGDDGSLTPKGKPIRVDPGTGPPQALVVDRADIVVVPELITGPYRTLRRGDDGTFRSGPTTQLTDEQRALGIPVRETLAQLLGGADKVPKRLPPLPLGTEGLSFHPEQDIMYSEQPPLSLLLVHEFDRSGRLTFVRGVKIQGGFLACWSTVSPDGRWLYISNAGTHTIAVFDVRDPRNPLQVQSLMLDGGGGHTFNLHIDPTGKRLFVLDSFSSMFDRPGLGNQLHMLSIGQGGRLSISPHGLVRMPVSFDTSVYGLALVPRVTPSDAN